jgi:hypothetical protein
MVNLQFIMSYHYVARSPKLEVFTWHDYLFYYKFYIVASHIYLMQFTFLQSFNFCIFMQVCIYENHI